MRSLTVRRISLGILLLFFWVVLPLVVVEIAMIVLEPYLFTGLYQYDSDTGFRVRPYYGGANRFGFNDKDYLLQRRAGNFRILVVSDSFNWAGGKDSNYTGFLRENLNAATPGDRVEVINAGYPGTHTGEQLLMLKKYGLQYKPDIVVLGFFAGNDFVDADPYRKRIIVNDIYIDIDKRNEMTVLGYPIVPKSRLLLFLKQKYKLFKERLKNQSENAASQGTFSEDTFLAIEAGRMSFCNVENFHQGNYASNIAFIFESFRTMRDLLQARGIPLLVAIYPDEFQVNDQLAAKVFSRFKVDPKKYDLTLMQKILMGFLESENIPYVDMLPRFREVANRGEVLYLQRDTHWNDAGNRLAALILQERLTPTVETYFETGATIIKEPVNKLFNVAH